MIKKVVGIILAVVIILGGGGFLYLRSYINSFDPIKLQYDNEVKSSLKRELDYSAFEDGLSKLTKEKIQSIDNLVIDGTVEEIQSKIFEGTLSCEDLVLYYVDRIKKYDSDYNSVIQLNSKALLRAKELDEKLKNKEKLGELFGSVLLIKDNISEMNMNTSTGAYALRDLKTKRDSFIVQQLKNSDAIILGKSNLSEWSNFMSMPSSNGFSVLGGQTKNSYGTYDVGGSSSGSSVAASLNFASVALGSETSGSLIYPAGQNSVVALKPTIGLLSRDLIIPISEAQDTAGVIGKNVSDVFKIFKVMATYDENDPLSKHVKSFNTEELNKELNKDYIKGKRLGIIKEDSERARTLKKELETLGAEVVEISIDEGELNLDMMSVLNYGIKEDVRAFLNHPDVDSSFKSLEEILEYNKKDEKNRMPYGAKLHEEALASSISKEEYEKIVAHNRKAAGEAIDRALRDNDIIGIVSFSNELSGIYASAMYPAITVPAGYIENGEPLGVTFVASLNEDYKLLNIGYAYEEGTHHRVDPLKK